MGYHIEIKLQLFFQCILYPIHPINSVHKPMQCCKIELSWVANKLSTSLQ